MNKDVSEIFLYLTKFPQQQKKEKNLPHGQRKLNFGQVCLR